MSHSCLPLPFDVRGPHLVGVHNLIPPPHLETPREERVVVLQATPLEQCFTRLLHVCRGIQAGDHLVEEGGEEGEE